jgi:mannosyltransferase OCH1-like enzyme
MLLVCTDCTSSQCDARSTQRADAMRLFFLHKYGGIYIDLDIECLRSLDFLRHYGWVMPQVGRDAPFNHSVWQPVKPAALAAMLTWSV